MKEILDVSDENNHQGMKKILRNLHSDEQIWIDRTVTLTSEAEMVDFLQQGLNVDDNSNKIKERMVEKEQQDVLMKKIQENFLFGQSESQTNGVIELARAENSKSVSRGSFSR